MTPFMLRVVDTMDGLDEDVEPIAPMPATRISQRIATGTGADRQVAIRSLAEQLVCEANAVLSSSPTSDEHLTLFDETLPHELAFNVGYRGRAARVSTTFEDGMAYGRLVGDGFESELPQELDGPDALPDLLIRLLVESS
jgi:hypothetical protein